MLVVLVTGGILLEVGTAASKFLFGMGLVKRYSGILFGAGIIKAVLSFACMGVLMNLGTGAAAPEWAIAFPITTLFVQLIAFGIVLPARIVQLTSITWRALMITALIRPVAMVVPATVVSVGAVALLGTPDWILLGIEFLLTTSVGATTAIFVLLTPDERTRLIGKLTRRISTKPQGH